MIYYLVLFADCLMILPVAAALKPQLLSQPPFIKVMMRVKFTKQTRWFFYILITDLIFESAAWATYFLHIRNWFLLPIGFPISIYFWGEYFTLPQEKFLKHLNKVLFPVFLFFNIVLFGLNFIGFHAFIYVLLFSGIYLSILVINKASSLKFVYEYFVVAGVLIYYILSPVIFLTSPSIFALVLQCCVTIIANLSWTLSLCKKFNTRLQ